ncbi:hypothetical protein GCM10010466_31780 [Planomonospora alba]|uniref:Rod shape-determining protein MreD n=1 Tax=Planomonospora alba TaxID=161354 RepID=A0ABP6N790_9ACTN
MRTRLAVAALLAPLLQVTLVERLPLPGGVVPDLPLLVAVVAGRACGPLAGVLTGFATGLTAGLIPPAVPPLGRDALVLCLTGYACGLLRRLPPPAALTLGVLGGSLAHAGLGALLGDPRVPAAALARVLPLAVPYGLLASPLVWFPITRRRRDPDHLPVPRTTDAKPFTPSFTLPSPPRPRPRDLALPRPGLPPVAGADPGRRPVRRSRRRRARAPHHPAGRTGADRR